MKTLTATEIIANRDHLTKLINDDWKRIHIENKIYKNETRLFNPKALYLGIKKTTDDRIKFKLYAQAINMGYSNFSEFPATSIYSIIFEISEINSMIVQLAAIPTINPKLKIKTGKQKLQYKEDITAAFVTKEINALDKRKMALVKLRDAYNAKATLTVEDAPLLKVAA